MPFISSLASERPAPGEPLCRTPEEASFKVMGALWSVHQVVAASPASPVFGQRPSPLPPVKSANRRPSSLLSDCAGLLHLPQHFVRNCTGHFLNNTARPP